MEHLPSSAAIQSETLIGRRLPMLDPSPFSSRRSHLDSASYRTLLRIFSLCLDAGAADGCPQGPPPEPNPSPRPDPEDKGAPFPVLEVAELGDGKGKMPSFDGGTEHSGLQILDTIDEFDVDEGSVDVDMLAGIMSDCSKLIDGSKDDGQVTQTRIDEPEKLGDMRTEDELLSINENLDELENAQESKEAVEEFLNDARTNGEPLVEGDMNSVPVDDEEFEEGEIPNDFDDTEPPPNFDEDEKHEDGSVCKILDANGNASCAMPIFANTRLDVVQNRTKEPEDGCSMPDKDKSWNDDTDPDIEIEAVDPDISGLFEENLRKPSKAAEVQIKKRARPSVERKAKKKIAKKRKRAQKEREQGVKRLKLQPIVKPKEVKICNFYLKGRCQQGDACKFSHEGIPMTKSQPCKYFACDSCLKGDDCPFDHELSKYPCHNYTSKGDCIRGDRCKFSHNVPVTGSPSPAPAANKANTHLSGKSSLAEQQKPLQKNTAASSSVPAVNGKPTAGKPERLVAANKEPVSIPKGVRFLSFNKGPASNADTQKGSQQKQEKLLLAARQYVSTRAEKTVSAAAHPDTVNKTMPVATVSSVPASTSVSQNSESKEASQQVDQVSEASRLLEEFLFCGSS